MTDLTLNTCMDFGVEYKTIELCQEAGAYIEETMLKSSTVTGIAYKCVKHKRF